MKVSLSKLIICILFLFPSNVNAELIFDDDFPKEMQGIWSENCNTEDQVFIISNNTSMWIDESYVGFNVSKTSKVQDWSAYKWGELEGSYYYFLKKDEDVLIELTAPENWDGIDYSFLNSSDYSAYEKCESIPSIYQIIYGEIINLMNSQLIETCSNDSNPANCINETFRKDPSIGKQIESRRKNIPAFIFCTGGRRPIPGLTGYSEKGPAPCDYN